MCTEARRQTLRPAGSDCEFQKFGRGLSFTARTLMSRQAMSLTWSEVVISTAEAT